MVLDRYSRLETLNLELSDDMDLDEEVTSDSSLVSIELSSVQRLRLEKLSKFRVGLGNAVQNRSGDEGPSSSKKQHLDNLQDLLVSLEGEIERYARLEQTNRELSRELAETRGKLDKEQHARQSEAARSAVLSKRVNETRAGLQTAHVEVANQTSQLEALKVHNEEFRLKIQQQDTEIRDLQETERRIERDNSKKSQKLNEATRKLKTTEQMLDESQNQNDSLKRMLEEDFVQREKLNDDITEARTRLLEAKSSKEDLETRFEVASNDLRQRSIEYDREIREKDNRIASLLAEIDSLKSEQRESFQLRETMEREAADYSIELNAEQDTVRQLNEQLLVERRTVEAEREQMLRYVSTISDQDIKITRLGDEKNDLLEQERRIVAEMKDVERQNKQLAVRVRRLEAIEKKYSRLKERQEKLAAKTPIKKPKATSARSKKSS